MTHSSIPWRWVVRRKAPPQPWTDERRVNALFHVQKVHLPAEFMGTVYATCRADALTLANALNEDPKAIVDVIAEAAWGTLTGLERSVFLGTFEPPKAADNPPSRVELCWRVSICKACGGEIRRKVVKGQNRNGRPRLYHDECESPRVRRWRKYEAAMRAVRKAEKARCGNVNKLRG